MEIADGSVYEGVVVYHSTLPGVQWEPQEITGDDPHVRKTVVETSNEGKGLSIRVVYDGTVSVLEAREFTDEVANRIVNRLAYHLDAFMEEPRYQGGSIIYQKPDGSHHVVVEVQTYGGVHVSVEDCLVYGAESTQAMCKLLKQPSLPGENSYAMYRVLQSIPDPVSQFMLFYLFLMQHHDDKQRLAEAFIKRHEPGVVFAKTCPPRPGKTDWTDETIYTRLRNEIAHDRKAPVQTTRTEIKQNLNGLKALVRKCLDLKG